MQRLLLALTALFVLALPSCRGTAQPVMPVNALKILVAKEGLHRVTSHELSAAGFSLSAPDVQTIQLTENRRAVPFVVDEKGLVFYGKRSESRYTPHRAYILRAGEPGLQMETRDASPDNGLRPLPAVRRTHFLERNVDYVSNARDTDDEKGPGPWFWQTIGLEPTEPITFQLPDVAGGSGQLRVRFAGISLHRTIDPDHNVQLSVNDGHPFSFAWDGQRPYVGEAPLSEGTLATGANRIQFLSAAQDHLDVSKLDWIEIEYDSFPRATQNYLAFSSDAGMVELEAFDAPPLIVDATNPDDPVVLDGWQREGNLTTVGLAREGRYVAAAGDGFLAPARVEPLQTGSWGDVHNQADLLIITTAELVDAVEPLIALRAEQGLTSVAIPVEEIYDGFGEGAASPDSINHFLKYAVENWKQPAPRYVLIVGDATVDFWGFLARRADSPVEPPVNQVPPYLVSVNFGGETVSDARLGDIDGDFVPDLAIGRWPVDRAEDVRQLIERTIRYETAAPVERAIFAIDDSSSEFARFVESILTASAFPRDSSQLLIGPEPGALAESWHDGAWLVTYAGHGSLQLWSKDKMLAVATLPSLLATGVQPVVLQLTCLTGLFAHPEIISLSEAMLTDENGPSLIVAATSLTLSAHQEPFAVALLNALQDPSVSRMGDALQLARSALDVHNVGLREINDTFALLGDPSTRIIRPQ